MSDPFERWKNPSGTYNGVAMLAELSGLDPRYVAWAAQRLTELMKGQGMPKDKALAVLHVEKAGKPWRRTVQ